MLKKIIRKIILGEKASSESFVAYLRKKGVQVGEDVRFYSPKNTLVDVSLPWLLSIGNHVGITHGVIILTHDYSWSVLKKKYGRILGAQSPVTIGDNVFIGMNAIITCGVTIGDNVIIGAGSIVVKDCEPDSVYAGSPAKRIMSIDEYYEKRAELQLQEAKAVAKAYKGRYGVKPSKEVFNEYFMLFCNEQEAKGCPKFNSQLLHRCNYDESCAYMREHPPLFDDFQSFLDECYTD